MASGAVAALVVAACGLAPAGRDGGPPGTGSGTGSDTGSGTAPAAAPVVVDRPAAPAAPIGTAEIPPDPTGEVAFGGTTFVLPAGWAVVDEGDGAWSEVRADTPVAPQVRAHPYTWMCLGPTGVTGSCGLTLYQGDLPGHEGVAPWDDHGDWPWHHATDVPVCPDAPGPGGPLDAVRPIDGDMGPSTSGYRPVGDRTAVYAEWRVECERSGTDLTVRSWHLPDVQFLAIDRLGLPETAAILTSVHVDG